jgi:hypothetical protein
LNQHQRYLLRSICVDPADDRSLTISADDGSSTMVPATTGSAGSFGSALSPESDGLSGFDGLSALLTGSNGLAGSDGLSALLTGSNGFAGSALSTGSYGFSGIATAAKPFDDSARKDMQAWFFGWLRTGVQHDERLLAKLEVIIENTRRANQAVPFPDLSKDMLQMREELASLDAVWRQEMAIAWVQGPSGQGDM